MCGRTAQTVGAVNAASTSLKTNSNFQGRLVDNIGPRQQPPSSSGNEDPQDNDPIPNSDGSFPWHDNFNLSPGHDAVVFTMNQQGEIQMDRKIWGLVTKAGTTKNPVPEGPSKHFANLMFNARSDTLFSKPTFSRLLGEGKTCLVALDGFFEWKADALGGGKGKKQPYFVFRNKDEKKTNVDRSYLLMAGLWTSVPTGYSPPQPATLDTFTILTTEVCDPLKWLHSRMPVCVWDEDLAVQWLQQPTQKLHQQLDKGANRTQETLLQWHAVSKEMNSIKFRSPDSIKAIRKPQSVKSFFAPVGSKQQNRASSSKSKDSSEKESASKSVKASNQPSSSTGTKRPPTTAKESPSVKPKKVKTNPPIPKKGSIASFFSPKKSKA